MNKIQNGNLVQIRNCGTQYDGMIGKVYKCESDADVAVVEIFKNEGAPSVLKSFYVKNLSLVEEIDSELAIRFLVYCALERGREKKA